MNEQKQTYLMRNEHFKTWYEALAFIQKNKIKDWVVVKVDDHYEVHIKC